MKRSEFITVLGGTIALSVINPLLLLKDKYEFCDESLAVFNAMTIKPDMEWKIALDIRIRELKDSGVWDKLDLLYDYGIMGKQNEMINWINP